MTEKPKKPPVKRKKAPETLTNVQALEITIQQLRDSGRLDHIDAARVTIALGLARAVDALPDNPTLWREYRAAEKALRDESEAHGDPFDDLIRSLSSEIRDETKPKAKNTRS